MILIPAQGFSHPIGGQDSGARDLLFSGFSPFYSVVSVMNHSPLNPLQRRDDEAEGG